MNPHTCKCSCTRVTARARPSIRYRIENPSQAFRRASWRRVLPAVLLALFLSPAELTRAQSVSSGAAFTNYVQRINGSTVTFEMVTIPGGSISVGSPPNELGRDTNDLHTRH